MNAFCEMKSPRDHGPWPQHSVSTRRENLAVTVLRVLTSLDASMQHKTQDHHILLFRVKNTSEHFCNPCKRLQH